MKLITDVHGLQGLSMNGAIPTFTHMLSLCAQEVYVFSLLSLLWLVFFFIVSGLHILDVKAYWRYAVENYFSDGTTLFITRLDAFPDQ